MTIELSKGKARTTMPRSSDLQPVEAVPNPSVGRGAGGRFAAGNPHGQRARQKHAIKKVLGAKVGDETVDAIVSDAERIFAGAIRELPHDGATVRQLCALQARHGALAAYYTALSASLGLDTPEGMAADERAIKHGARVERLAVTSLDIATKLAAARPQAPIDIEAHVRAGIRPC